jgi:hypothetical protein
MRKRLPAANELVYDNYNFLVIAYCPSNKGSSFARSHQTAPAPLNRTGPPAPAHRAGCTGAMGGGE